MSSLTLVNQQDPSLRLVPTAGGPSKASVKDTANELGVHDALRNGPRSLSNEVKGGSAIQQRLEKVRTSR
jgi:proteasome maturation protein